MRVETGSKSINILTMSIWKKAGTIAVKSEKEKKKWIAAWQQPRPSKI